jgi:hypothetical protein
VQSACEAKSNASISLSDLLNAMNRSERRYWAIRTSRDNQKLLFGELYADRLRQGWGFDPSQDLRLIQAEISRGGNWWERLTETQKQVLPHLKMLSASEGGAQVGDWVLAPNLPENGRFVIAEITGDYYFDPLPLRGKDDTNNLGMDFGHVLPVRLMTQQGINPHSDVVDARIRSTLRTQSRMWNLDGYRDEIIKIVEAYKAGKDFVTPVSGEARLQTAWEVALSHAEELLRDRLGSELDARFQAAEWEEPIKYALGRLYPSTNVRWVAGPREDGADVVVQLPNHFGGFPWLIVVQVKNYAGEIGPAVLQQLRTAYARYSTEGQILALVVMTTAEKMAPGLRESADKLEKELSVPAQFVLRKEMLKLLSSSLVAGMRDLP